jgi:hypothetical protein
MSGQTRFEVRAGDRDERGETIGFCPADGSAESGQAKIAAPSVVVGGRTSIGFLDKVVLDQLAERPVQRGRTHAHHTARGPLDGAHDGVPVTIAGRERHKDMKLGLREWKERPGLGRGFGVLHNLSIYQLSIYCQAIDRYVMERHHDDADRSPRSAAESASLGIVTASPGVAF